MATHYITRPQDGRIPLPPRAGMPAAVHVIDDRSVFALNAALARGRPLLVRGEPGTGKSQLARAAAEALGRAFIPYAVDARTETRDLLYIVDVVARLAEAQVAGAIKDEAARKERIDVGAFVEPGPLWWAFDWTSAAKQADRAKKSAPVVPAGWTPNRGVVVLIDEIDKADASVPNGMLDALGHNRFDVQGHPTVELKADPMPLVVITTNEERALPDAFLRRCFVLQLALPKAREELVALLIERGQAHFGARGAAVLEPAAKLVADDREALRSLDLALPGVAEYLDLVGAVIEQRRDPADQLELLKLTSRFALRKHPET